MSNQGEGANVASARGSVHARDGSDDSSLSPPRKRRRGEDAYEHPHVLIFAARGKNGRFYIPSTENSFGGVNVNNTMFDTGCSTLLLPYPLQTGFPADLMNGFLYSWVVGTSRGTGALHSQVLKITSKIRRKFPVTLAGKQQESKSVSMLRFQLGTGAIRQLLDTPNLRGLLDETCITNLTDFLDAVGDREIVESRYALLGQSYFKDTSQFQTGDVTLVLSSNMPTTENLWEIAARYHEKLLPMVKDFPNWSDLEDHDSDIDGDEEEYNLSWDPVNSDDEIDELVDR